VRDSSAEREFPSDKVYRRDNRGVIRVESFGLQCLAFVVMHTRVGRGACCYGSRHLSPTSRARRLQDLGM
jgi:hypothetical protein